MRLFKTAQGRTSILLAIEGLARKDKKFIITQSFTCVAVPEAIIKSGYKPFWLDIELQTFSIDLEKFKESLKKYEREFAALIIQHTYGITPKYYNEIKKIALENNIPLIEDRCHCNFMEDYKYLRSNFNSNKIAYCYSFENAKPIKLGRGGLLILSEHDESVLKTVENIYYKFGKQSNLDSILNFSIAIAYIIFRNTKLYWPLLDLYRYFAKKGLLPSNFKSTLKDLKYEKIGLIQFLIISFLIMSIEVDLFLAIKYKSYKAIRKILRIFFKNPKKFPLYVNNKKNAINYCKKNNIAVSDYFNGPVQPLNSDQYHLVDLH